MHKVKEYFGGGYSSNSNVLIWRMNPKTGLRESRNMPHEGIPNNLKREGWKPTVKPGKRIFAKHVN